MIDGTFYNSFGLFASLEKVFNEKHSFNLTAWGAPTQRATNSATYLEAYNLADNYLYNPNWGYQDGRRRADPPPDYYRYLPSYFMDNGQPTEASELYTDLWRNNESFRQIKWDELYQANYLNNIYGRGGNPNNHSSTYILENRHSNQINLVLNSVLNHRLNDHMTLQAGASVNYTRAHYYKTIRDLLGGEYWLDIDQYSERDFPSDPEKLQNDLRNPSRHVGKDDVFGYDYYINAIHTNFWIQNQITLPQWDINYGLKLGFTQFQRDGKMQNGRAPKNSYGKGETHRFDTGALKAGATYKIDGRNFISAHVGYETQAPLFEYAYISPRIKDTAIEGLTPERILTGVVR